VDRNRPEKTTKSYFKPDVQESLLYNRNPFTDTICVTRGGAGGRRRLRRVETAQAYCRVLLYSLRVLAGHARDFRRMRAASNCIACPAEFIAPLEEQENEYADTLFAGAVQPRVALCVWRFASYLSVMSLHSYSPPRNMASRLGKPRAWLRRRRRCREGPSRVLMW
jgi:hypothetical protein